MYLVDDAVLESTTTNGTGVLTLAGAVTGMKAFASALRPDGSAAQAGDLVPYALWAVDGSGNRTGDWEDGIGTLTTLSTLTRTTVLRSSNSNAAVTLTTGTKYVALSAIGSRMLALDNELTALTPVTTASLNPASPPAGFLKWYAQSIAGRPTPRYIPPSGVDQTFQDKISENGGCFYLPNGTTVIGLNYGLTWVSGGTVSHPTPASTAPAVYSQQKRTRWANVVTTANQVLGLTTAAVDKSFWRGNAAGLGGFNFHARFAVGLWPAATVRLFAGLTDQPVGTAIVTSNTLAGNACGFWHDTADAATVLSFVTRDGTTTNKVSVGTLAASLAAGQTYDCWIWSAPNGSTIGYRLVSISNNQLIVEGSTSTNLPTNTAFMGPELAMSNGTANTVVTTTAFELMRMSCQSDN